MTASLIAVVELTHVAEARRRAAEITRDLGFDEVSGGRAAIAVTEAATNLLKHGGGGEIFVGATGVGHRRGLQVIAMDRGQGMRDTTASLVDGYSTAGTAGTGLGAIRRVSDSFDVYSTPTGTVVAATVYPPAVAGDDAPLPLGAVSVPAPGEQECGDAWAVWSAGELTSVFVCDGLGHGPEAAVAATTAVETFRRYAERPAAEVIGLVHDALKRTRGGAVALAELDRRQGSLRYCGVGNVSAVIARPDGQEQHLVTLAGIAGHVMRRVHAYTYEWPRGSALVMHSDGLGTHWSLSRYDGLAMRRPDIIAGVLYRDHRRGRDDATAVVLRNTAPEPEEA